MGTIKPCVALDKNLEWNTEIKVKDQHTKKLTITLVGYAHLSIRCRLCLDVQHKVTNCTHWLGANTHKLSLNWSLNKSRVHYNIGQTVIMQHTEYNSTIPKTSIDANGFMLVTRSYKGKARALPQNTNPSGPLTANYGPASKPSEALW